MIRFVVPALTFFTDAGEVDWPANRAYAGILNAVHIPVLLFGTTGEGLYLTADEKDSLAEIYGATSLELTLVLNPHSETDIATRYRNRARLLHRPWNRSAEEFVRFHRDGDRSWGIYSHPGQASLSLTVEVLSTLVSDAYRPWGAKVSKVDGQTISQMRDVVGSDFQIWHGTDRDIVGSVEAGADRVVSQALATGVQVPADLSSAQALIDRIRPAGPGKIESLKRAAAAARSLRMASTCVRSA